MKRSQLGGFVEAVLIERGFDKEEDDDVISATRNILWKSAITGSALLEKTKAELEALGIVDGPASTLDKKIRELNHQEKTKLRVEI